MGYNELEAIALQQWREMQDPYDTIEFFDTAPSTGDQPAQAESRIEAAHMSGEIAISGASGIDIQK